MGCRPATQYGGRLGVLHEHGTEGWLGTPDQPGGPRVPQGLAPGERAGGWPRSATVRTATAPARTSPAAATAAPPGVAYVARSRSTQAPISWLSAPPRAVACTARVRPTRPRAATTDQAAAR